MTCIVKKDICISRDECYKLCNSTLYCAEIVGKILNTAISNCCSGLISDVQFAHIALVTYLSIYPHTVLLSSVYIWQWSFLGSSHMVGLQRRWTLHFWLPFPETARLFFFRPLYKYMAHNASIDKIFDCTLVDFTEDWVFRFPVCQLRSVLHPAVFYLRKRQIITIGSVTHNWLLLNVFIAFIKSLKVNRAYDLPYYCQVFLLF